MWVRFGSSLRFTKGVYRKLICQANNIKVYFGLLDISRGSITIDDKLFGSHRRDFSLRFEAGIREAIFNLFLAFWLSDRLFFTRLDRKIAIDAHSRFDRRSDPGNSFRLSTFLV